MPDRTDRRDGQAFSRRAVIAGSAALAGGVVGLTGSAAGQLAFPAVIPRPERWADENLAGFMVHVGGATDPAELSAARNCTFEGWPPEETLAYDATLINRKQADTPESETILYAGRNADVPPGALFLINEFERCESDYVGVNLRQIGRYDVGEPGGEQATDYGPGAEVEPDERPTEATENDTGGSGGGGIGAVAPGFGVLAALAALLGGGALLGRRGGDDADDEPK